MPTQIAWTPGLRLSVTAILILIVLCLTAVLSFQRPGEKQFSSYHHYDCPTGSLQAETLRILLVSPELVEEISSMLCAAESVRQQFSQVEVTWKSRMSLTTEDLITERYDVIWNRHHFLQGLMPDFDDHYDTLLHYADHAVYWMSTRSEPVLSDEYFEGKRVGLLNDSASHTLNIIPLTSLRSLSARHEIVYFDDPETLFDSFYRGDVDLVSGGFGFEVPTTVYRTIIDDSATAATFFVRSSLADMALRCDLVDALSRLQNLWQGVSRHTSGEGECR